MKKRLIVKNSMFNRIEKQLGYFPNIQVDCMDEADFLNALPTMNDTVILGYGYEFYEKLRALHTSGKIHIGLRNFRYSQFVDLSAIHIGTNKLIFGKYPVKSDEAVLCGDGTYQQLDAKLSFFLSDKVFKEPLKLPEPKIVGIKEGIEVLKNEFLTHIGEEVGFDFETSGFPEEHTFKISGFSLSSKKRMIAYFFDFRKDYNYIRSNITQENQQDYNTFLQLMYQYLKMNEAHVWTYNCAFEIHACKILFHDFLELQDTYALTLCDDKRGSLKYNVQFYLNSPSWDDSLDKQQEYIGVICEYVHDRLLEEYGDNVTKEQEIEYFNNMLTHWNDLIVDDKCNVVMHKHVTESGEEISRVRIKGDDHCDWLRSKRKHVKADILMEAMNLYIDESNEDKDEWQMMIREYWGDAWFACNAKQLGVYCCYDSFYTVALAELLSPAYKDIVCPDGSICQGPYKTFLYNRYMGVELKGHGIVIDTDKRDKLENWVINLEENCATYMNKLYLDLYMSQYDKYFKDIIPQLTDAQRRVVGLDPNFKTYFTEQIVGYDKVWLSKSVFNALITPELQEIMNKEGKLPHNILNNLLGFDYSDELQQIDSFTLDGFTSFMRKRGYLGSIGNELYRLLNIKGLRSIINRKLLEIVKDNYNAYIEKMKRLWAFPNVPIHNASKLFDLVALWKKKQSKDKVVIYNADMTIKESLKLWLKNVYPDITDPEVNSAMMIPEDIVKGVLPIKNINDESEIEEFIDSDITTWIPEEVRNQFKELPTSEKFFQYCVAIREFKIIDNCNNKVLEPTTTLNSNTQTERYINWFSSTQMQEFLMKYKHLFFDWVYMVKCFYDIKGPAYDPVKKKELDEDTLKQLTEFKFDDWVKMYRKNMEGYVFYGSDKFKETYGNIIEPKSMQRMEPDIALHDLLIKTSYFHLDEYGILDLDQNINIEYPEDMSLKIAKFIVMYNISASARKIRTNYIKAMHEEVVKPHNYNNKRFIQIERVNGWDKSERDLRLYYSFNINKMETKRTGSGSKKCAGSLKSNLTAGKSC